MRKLSFVVATAAVVALGAGAVLPLTNVASSQTATRSGEEIGKGINVLRIVTAGELEGTIFVALQQPGPSAECGFSILDAGNINDATGRATYAALLSANTTNRAVNVGFEDCGVTYVQLQQ
jgi:hypothetical protein